MQQNGVLQSSTNSHYSALLIIAIHLNIFVHSQTRCYYQAYKIIGTNQQYNQNLLKKANEVKWKYIQQL